MKKIEKILLFILLLPLLYSCQSMSDAAKVLRNEKTRTTDEFLVKKRDPLVLPPNFKNLPKPGSVKKTNKNDQDKINQILRAPNNNSASGQSSSVEQSILDKIGK